MKLRKLGQSDLRITPTGVGAWAIGGGKWEFAWGHQDDAQSIAAIHAALDMGVNWIDTAAVYGLGHSETVVGQAIRGLSNRPYVFTKCSLVWDESGNISHNLQAASIRREAEASLKRMKIDAIDLYQIHWPAWKGNPESASPGSIEEAVGELAKLKAEFRCGADAARSRRCANHVPSTAVFSCGEGCRAVNSSLRTQSQDRGHRLFPDGFRSAQRCDDPRANCLSSRGRLAQTQCKFPGTAALPKPAPGRNAEGKSPPLRSDSWRDRHRVDVAAPRGNRCHRRCSQRPAGTRHRGSLRHFSQHWRCAGHRAIAIPAGGVKNCDV